jgi:ATP-dependent protease HslVU (ClpYQ) peptidase subunit
LDDITYVRKGCSKAWEFQVSGARFLAGFAGNYAEGNFIRYCFKWPNREYDQSIEMWLHSVVQPLLCTEIKKRFEDRANISIEWELILCSKQSSKVSIFKLGQCGDVEESLEDFDAIGSGCMSALTSFAALKYSKINLVSWEFLDIALKVTEDNHGSVRGPFHFLTLV